MAGDRTEQATPERRNKARREGDLLVSRELTGAAGTLVGVLVLGFAAPRFVTAWRETMAGILSLGASAAWEAGNQERTLVTMRNLAWHALTPMALVAVAVTGGAVMAGVLQTGGVSIHPERLAWKPERINPAANLKNIFSLRAAARLAKSLIPSGALAVVAVEVLVRQFHLPPFSLMRLNGVAADGYRLLTSAAWLTFAWALVDYLVEWRSREQRLKMSKQEMREEFRDQEGNPQIRSRIRNLQRAARRRRMKADVSRAAVVITNPTHYAVALAFDFDKMDAPRVVAKGRNLLAEEMKAEARWAGVPIQENPPLARSLYRMVEAGQPIPSDLYAAVAAILAFLYRQRVEEQTRARRKTASTAPRPDATDGAGAARLEPLAMIRSTWRPAGEQSRDGNRGDGGN